MILSEVLIVRNLAKMMKLMLLLISLNVACLHAIALTAPQALEQAKKGRFDFIQVSKDIQQQAHTLKDPSELFSFILILDNLSVIAKEYDFNGQDSNPMNSMAHALTREASKWIDFGHTDWDRVGPFLKWSDNETRNLVLTFQTELLSRATTKESIQIWAVNAQKSYQLLVQLKAEPEVIVNYSGFQSIIIKKVLNNRAFFSGNEVTEMIKNTSSVGGISGFASFLMAEIYSNMNSKQLNDRMQWAIFLGESIRAYPFVLPSHLENTAYQLIKKIIDQLLAEGGNPLKNYQGSLSKAMTKRQVSNLLYSLKTIEIKRLTRSQVEFLWFVLGDLKVVVKELNDDRLDQFIFELTGQIAMKRVLINNDYEGTYDIQFSNETAGRITIARTDSSHFIVGISGPLKGGVAYSTYSMMYINFNKETDMFEAYSFKITDPQLGIPSQGRYFMSFKFKRKRGQMRIRGIFNNGLNQFPFKGIQVEKYPEYHKPAESIMNPTGIYRGDLEWGFERIDNATLSLHTAGDQFAGSLVQGSLRIDFPFGTYNKTFNNFILTRGPRHQGLNWIQLRGQIIGKKVYATYIIGGRGIRFDYLGRFVD